MGKLCLTVAIRHSLLIGGQTSSLLADVTTAREESGAPIIPASALKGALRIEFERVAAGLGKQVCHPSRPEHACKPNSLCLACEIFGSPGREGKLRFHDARLDGNLRELFTKEDRPRVEPASPTGKGYTIRQGVAINRVRKVAEEEMLFASETVAPFPMPLYDPSPLVFEAEVEIAGPLSNDEFELLQAAALSLQAIGADKSRGLGHLEAKIERSESVPDNKTSQPNFGTDVMITLLPLEYVRVSGVKATNNFLETLEFLPGGAVRGAVAKSFASAQGGWKNTPAQKVFISNPVLFSDFYPNATAGPFLPKPIPLSARTCKAFPGFCRRAATAKERASHGAKDILIAATVVKLLHQQGIPVALEEACEHIEDGKRCDSAMKELKGFYLSPEREGEASMRVSRRTTTKTAINRSRFTAAEGQLYSYEVLNPRLECSDELTERDKRRLRFVGTARGLTGELGKYMAENKILFIGAARGRGFGKMKIEKITDLEDEKLEDLENRFITFTSHIKRSLTAAEHPKRNRLFFSLTITSDLVLPPGAGLDWLKGEVEKELDLSGKDLGLEKVFVRTDYRSGFNEAFGVQKDLLPVFVRGSAFVFSCNDDAEKSVIKGLPNLLRNGLGWRREEGFGRMSFCDPFHLERMNQA